MVSRTCVWHLYNMPSPPFDRRRYILVVSMVTDSAGSLPWDRHAQTPRQMRVTSTGAAESCWELRPKKNPQTTVFIFSFSPPFITWRDIRDISSHLHWVKAKRLQFKSNLTNHAKHFQTLSGFNLRITWVWQSSVCAVQRFPEMSANIVCQTLSKPPTHLLLFACVRLQLFALLILNVR